VSLATTTLSFVLCLLLGTSAFVLVQPSASPLGQRLIESREEMLSSVPDAAARERLRESSAAVAREIRPRLARRFGGARLDPGPAAAAVAVRATLAGRVAPLGGVLVLLAAFFGLLRRRLLIDRHGFHSLTWSYLGKLLVVGSWGAFAFTALSPLAPPLWTLYVDSALAAVGTALWFRNLPPRL
jgi:hypothetical protein